MEVLNPESLRYILGLKVRHYRQARGFGLKELKDRSSLSISYLSEIEKGRKYPKPDKLLLLAKALEVSFDDLVSLEMDDELRPVRDLLESPFIREFPFHVYGVELHSVLSLLAEEPSKAGAMVRTALEIGRLYDLRVEHFLLAALRSYQYLRQNYFADIESAAEGFRGELGLAEGEIPTAEALCRVLQEDHGYQVDSEELSQVEDLAHLRSVFRGGSPPRLWLNGRLRPSQQAFMAGRELAYLRLGLGERSETSPALEVTSFDQVIHDFEAAYFSGAVLLDRHSLEKDLAQFFESRHWSPSDFLELLERYRTTPETFFYRLSQLLPARFGLRDLFFVRFNHRANTEERRLTKILDLSGLSIPYGLDEQEHYCRRWVGLESLDDSEGSALRATIQRARFLVDESEYLVFSLSRPLSLAPDVRSSVSLGLRLDPRLRRRLRFFQDSSIPRRDVHLTCERCPLPDCAERAAPPVLVEQQEVRERRAQALGQLLSGSSSEGHSKP